MQCVYVEMNSGAQKHPASLLIRRIHKSRCCQICSKNPPIQLMRGVVPRTALMVHSLLAPDYHKNSPKFLRDHIISFSSTVLRMLFVTKPFWLFFSHRIKVVLVIKFDFLLFNKNSFQLFGDPSSHGVTLTNKDDIFPLF